MEEGSTKTDSTATDPSLSADPGANSIAQPAESVPTSAEPIKPVICKKGKCQPYDPAKDRVNILNWLAIWPLTESKKPQVIVLTFLQFSQEEENVGTFSFIQGIFALSGSSATANQGRTGKDFATD